MPNPQMAVKLILLGPPMGENREALWLLMNRPIKLRRHVIAPAVGEPFHRIGVQAVILINSRLNSFGNTGTINAEWANPKLHPALLFFDSAIERRNKLIH